MRRSILGTWLARLGMEAEQMPTPGWLMVMGRCCDRLGAATVLLYGHYDVQPHRSVLFMAQ